MIKKRTFIGVISILSVVILIIGVFAVKEKKKNDKYVLMIENQYSRAFEQLNSSLNNISVAMQKTAYVSSAKTMGALATEIFSEAELAKSALSELPMGANNISTIYRFLSQVGNYAISVAKKITSENSVTSKQREELKLLSNTANIITQVINDVGIEYNNADEWAKVIENKLDEAVDEGGLADSLTELEEDLSDYPTLIFDGPYSDHILNKQPLMTAVANEFSKEEALAVARKVSDKSGLGFSGMQEGKIVCYCFQNDDMNIAISKKGGYPVFMRKNRAVKQNKIKYEQAILAAKEFLEKIKFNSMVDTYYYTDDGICVVNFAYLDHDTICYTDLIKVGVAMDTGEIMLLETAGYLANHTTRAFREPMFTIEEAKQKISSDLKIEKSTLALIPTNAGGESRCYEFLCRTEEKGEILVYINANTLDEEQIFILLKSDGGTLVK